MLKYEDRLFDVIFGYINLTQIERELIHTPIFQRLHHIKQLGMANLIFPNAVHTRFSHSLGVMHIMDLMIKNTRNQEIIEIDEKEHQTLRLAALLHDIGHFPFSHVGEKATESIAEMRVTETQIERKKGIEKEEDQGIRPGKKTGSSKLHERMSQRVVLKWKEIVDILESHSFDPSEIGRIIIGASSISYQTILLHSELDADRLDYLIRDSNALGVSYGNIELEHIISTLGSAKIGEESIIGVTEKGLHAVEHYVLARYFMYSQIIFYPKIYYLESTLQRVYEYMIESSDEDVKLFDENHILQVISDNDLHSFYDFNDNYVFYRMRLLHDKLDKKFKQGSDLSEEEFIVNESIKLLLSGQIPSPLLVKKVIIDQNLDINTMIEAYRTYLTQKIKIICTELGLSEQSVFFDFISVKPTKMRSLYSPSRQATPDEREEAIRIIYDNGNVEFLVESPGTILKYINSKQLQLFYLFVNPILISKYGIDYQKVEDSFNAHIDLNVFF